MAPATRTKKNKIQSEPTARRAQESNSSTSRETRAMKRAADAEQWDTVVIPVAKKTRTTKNEAKAETPAEDMQEVREDVEERSKEVVNVRDDHTFGGNAVMVDFDQEPGGVLLADAGGNDDDDDEGDTHVIDTEEDELAALDKDEEDVGDNDNPRSKVRSRRAKINLKRHDPKELKSLNFGDKTALPEMSKRDYTRCLEEFEQGMKRNIKMRKQDVQNRGAANLAGMSIRCYQWWKRRQADAIWHFVETHTSVERRVVLGGIRLGLCKFEDLPTVTEAELRGWLVYADHVTTSNPLLHDMYVGSATAWAKDKLGAWARMSQYERAKRLAMDDVEQTIKGAHLSRALDKDSVMNFRVLAIADPRKTQVGDVLILEGLFVDYLQSYENDVSGPWSTPELVELSKATWPEGKDRPAWRGLNRAHPFFQGMRGDSVKFRVLQEMDFTCELCERCGHGVGDESPEHWGATSREWRRTFHSSWAASGGLRERFDLTSEWVCSACKNFGSTNPECSREKFGGDRRQAANMRNNWDMEPAEVMHHLREQDFTCPTCLKKKEHGLNDFPVQQWTLSPFEDCAGWTEALSKFMCFPCHFTLMYRVVLVGIVAPKEKAKALKKYRIKSNLNGQDVQVKKTWLAEFRRFQQLRQEYEVAIAPRKFDESDEDRFVQRYETRLELLAEWEKQGNQCVVCGDQVPSHIDLKKEVFPRNRVKEAGGHCCLACKRLSDSNKSLRKDLEHWREIRKQQAES